MKKVIRHVHGGSALQGSSYRSTYAKLSALVLAALFALVPAVWGQTEFKLTADDAANWDNFGYSVGIHGDYAIVGAIQDEHSGVRFAGSAYIFKRVGNSWMQIAKLIAADPIYDSKFGYRVAITDNHAIISAYGVSYSGFTYAGSAYIFKRDGESWIQEAKIIDDEPGNYDFFGAKVAIDGEWAVIGNPDDDISGVTNAGSVYIFKYVNNSWIQDAKLLAAIPQTNDLFGMSVAISDDLLVIGTASDIYIYRHDGNSWIQETKLTEDGGFGYSVAINGNYLICGAIYDDPLGIRDAGSAYIFKYEGDTWIKEAKLMASDPDELDRFGASVSISGDYAIVGAPWHGHSGFSGAGTVYVFKRNGSNWTEELKLTPSDAANEDLFGYENISIDGYSAIIGSLGNDEKGSNAGAAYVYILETPNQPPVVNANGPYNLNEGSSVLVIASGDDPDGDPLTYAWDFDNDGAFETSGQQVTCSATGLDGPSSHTISVQVTDPGGLTATDQATVNVLNVAPTATFTSTSSTIIVRQSVTLSFSNQFDPSVADVTEGFTYSYDCTNDGTFEISDIAATTSYTCSYPTNGTFTAKGRIKDKDGDFTDYTVDIVVQTSREATGSLIDQVQALIDDGILNQGQGNGLIAKLEAAIQQLDKGNTKVAINQLQAFINQVNDFMNSTPPLLTAAEGQPLINAANAIIAALSNPAPSAAAGLKKDGTAASELPTGFQLEQNSPNPFNPVTAIQFSVPREGYVRLKVYNTFGAEVATLVDQHVAAGTYKVNWDASRLASGFYLYRLEAEGFVQTKKLLLMK